jgi:predicted MPP superfamily phosphohydrolase
VKPGDVLHVLLLSSVVAGHVLLVRGLLARLYRLAMPWLVWVAVFGVLLASCVVVPAVLVRHVGRHGPRGFRGGLLADVPVAWQVYGGLCLGALSATLVSRVKRRKDAALLAERRRTVDVAATLDPRPVGAGVRALVARAPLNQIFHVEVAEREVALPNLPAELDGLSVLHLSDLHFNGTPGRAFFGRAVELALPLKPDLIALTGDILDRHARADWLPATLGRLDAPLGRYFILGNHDVLDEPAEIRSAMTALGWTDVGGRALTVERSGSRVVVAGTERPWHGPHPTLPGARREPSLRLLLAHTPEQFGWARSQNVDLVLAGHLHGGQIDLPLFGPVSGGRYVSGVFSHGPTVMHVSRGLGVMFPLRLNCPAEITKIILHARPTSGLPRFTGQSPTHQ